MTVFVNRSWRRRDHKGKYTAALTFTSPDECQVYLPPTQRMQLANALHEGVHVAHWVVARAEDLGQLEMLVPRQLYGSLYRPPNTAEDRREEARAWAFCEYLWHLDEHLHLLDERIHPHTEENTRG